MCTFCEVQWDKLAAACHVLAEHKLIFRLVKQLSRNAKEMKSYGRVINVFNVTHLLTPIRLGMKHWIIASVFILLRTCKIYDAIKNYYFYDKLVVIYCYGRFFCLRMTGHVKFYAGVLELNSNDGNVCIVPIPWEKSKHSGAIKTKIMKHFHCHGYNKSLISCVHSLRMSLDNHGITNFVLIQIF